MSNPLGVVVFALLLAISHPLLAAAPAPSTAQQAATPAVPPAEPAPTPIPDERTTDPKIYGARSPLEYESFVRHAEPIVTRYGGNDQHRKTDRYPIWKDLFAGFPFATDPLDGRGHPHMLADQEASARIRSGTYPGACVTCHAAIRPAILKLGAAAGIPDDRPEDQAAAGFRAMCAMTYADARALVDGPLSCGECHVPKSMKLRVKRPAFLAGLRDLARSTEEVAALPSIAKWRSAGAEGDYDPNRHAGKNEMRALVCAQCHSEFRLGKQDSLVSHPWSRGLSAEAEEAVYDAMDWSDFEHATSGARLVKVQNPEFETWSQGIHARSGVTCADCHLPRTKTIEFRAGQTEGVETTWFDHAVRSPLANLRNTCSKCHGYETAEIEARVYGIQDRIHALEERTEHAVVDLINAIGRAKAAGATDEALREPRAFHRQAHWRLDLVLQDGSHGFHSPHEASRLLAEAIDLARQGELIVTRIRH